MSLLRYVICAALTSLLLGGPLPTGAATEAEFLWQPGPSTREALAGAVLENDLVYVEGNGQPAANYYPQAAVVQVGPIAGEQPGRYRVRLRARTEKLAASPLVLQAWVPQESGGAFDATGYGQIPIPLAATSMSGYRFAAPGEWQDFTLEFEVESGKPVRVGLMYLGEATCAAGRVQVEKASLSLEKVDLPLRVGHALVSRLRYHHGEPGEIQVQLCNDTAQPQTVQARPVVVDEAGKSTSGPAVTLTIPPGTLNAVLPFALPAQDGGYEGRAEILVAGKVVESRSADVFCLSDSPFQFAIQAHGDQFPRILSSAGALASFRTDVMDNWDAYEESCREALGQVRRNYLTYMEWFAWAREDATVMTEDSDEPYLAGQCSWPVSRKQVRLINDLLRSQGIAPVAYLNSIPFGWPGFEVVRRHPEWYVGANFNTELLEKYQNDDQGARVTYPCISMDFEARSANGGQTYLDYHIGQLIDSAAMYGWEAYRYDAGPLSAQYFPAAKTALAKLNPPVAIGNNLGVCCLGNQPSADWTTYCRDGSYMMEEMIRSAFHSPTSPQRRWADWIGLLRTGAHLTRSVGGHYTYINAGGNWLSTALGFAVGGHPWGAYDSPYGEQKRFMVRYGYYFWDLRTQFLDASEKVLTVTSPRPVWWKPLVSERRLGPGHRQVIVPLFNPPAGEQVVDLVCEAPAEGVVVTFTPAEGETVTACVLTPEPVATRAALPIKTLGDGRAQVTVPRFWGWSNVVFDCGGK